MFKRFSGFTLLLIIALGVLYLLERQSVYEQVKRDVANSIALEHESLSRRVLDWQRSLNGMARLDAIQRLMRAFDENQSTYSAQRTIEQVFLEVQQSSEGQLSAISLIDRFGQERVVVRNGKIVSDFLNLADDPAFRQAMAQRPFQIIPGIKVLGKDRVLSLNINIAANGIVSAVITMEIDASTLLNYLNTNSEYQSIYLVDDKGSAVFQRSGSAVISSRNLRHILEIYEEQGMSKNVLKQDGSLWGSFKDEKLNLQVLVAFDGNQINKMVFQNLMPKFILLVVVSFIILLFFTRRLNSGSSVSEIQYTIPKIKLDKSPTVNTQELANISNEIRTPLNSILGMLSLLHETKLSSKQYEYIDLANKSGEWVLELVNELSDYAKLRANQLQLESIDFNLRNTIKDITEMLSIEAYKKGLEVTSLINSRVPERVTGDPSRLRQVLINLITHAINFTDHGDIAISASVVREEESRNWVRFEVNDTGLGVDSQLQKEFFEDTKNAYQSVDGTYNISKLGLTLSKKLVEMMGGQIGVGENGTGGATFWFEIPYSQATVDNKQIEPSSLESHRVFLVGEIEGNRKTISTVLGKWGMQCDASGDFADVTKQLVQASKKQNPYSFVIIDISLSSSGDKAFDLIRQIKKQKNIAESNIIILTAKGAPGEGQTARDLGVKAYLSKPINRSQLRDTLTQIAGGMRALENMPMVTKHSLKEDGASGHSVLVVEDNVTNQKVLAGFLSRLGLNADIATNGMQALEAVRKRPYDLVIMDTQMPDMDGLETTRQVREYEYGLTLGDDKSVERALRTPIIALASSFEDEDKEECLRVGMDGFLKKPVNMKTMEDLLVQWGLIKSSFAQVS